MKDIIDSCQAQDAVLQDMNRLNEALLASSEAKVRDMTLQKQRIEEQIQAVQADLDFLAPLVAGTLAAAGAEGAAETDAALLTSSDEAQDENFMDVIIKSDESGSFSSNSSSSSSTQSSWNLGGWFNPTIFKLSDNYYRLADIRVSKGLTKTDIHKASAESSRQYMEQSDARGGGIFGFRANSGSSSKSQSESAYFGSTSNYFYIRIPGPQILGWFLELTPADNASPYQKLDPSMYSDTLDALLPEQKESGEPESGGTT